MCTQTRTPSASRRAEIASSKSLAVSGSIVNVSKSRRSTRPAIDGSGGSNGSNGSRSPRWTSSPSSTASMSSARPSTYSSFARPRPGRTTARSPSEASPSPFVSRSNGLSASKYGSPTTSLPRRVSSTTVTETSQPRPGSDLEETPQGETRARGAERETGEDERRRVERERPRVHVGARIQSPEDRREHDRLAQDEQDDGAERADEPAHQTFEHERPAHEPVRGADE